MESDRIVPRRHREAALAAAAIHKNCHAGKALAPYPASWAYQARSRISAEALSAMTQGTVASALLRFARNDGSVAARQLTELLQRSPSEI